jgi:hypothetical protein
MQITEQQAQALRDSAIQRFVKRLTHYVANECDFSRPHDGSEALVGEPLAAAIHELVSQARSLGIRTELAAGQFVILGIGYSREFFRDPRIARMLHDEHFSPEENVQRVLNAVIVAEARRA